MTDAQSAHEHAVENATRRLRWAAEGLAEHSESIALAGQRLGAVLKSGGKILAVGNGGSAACAQHFAAEFTGKLALDRPPLPAIALTTDTSALTAIANDWSYEDAFGRMVEAIGTQGDVLVAMSTSGTSSNIQAAVAASRRKGIATLGLTGPHDELGCDHSIRVRVRETARVQEIHDLVLHQLAQIAEREVFPDLANDASVDQFPVLLPLELVGPYRNWIEESGQSLVTTNGVFDLLHRGHLDSLNAARTMGDQLVVLVNSDASVTRLKGPERPINTFDVRASDLSGCSSVSHIICMDDDTPARLLADLRPHVHAKGMDYRDKPMPEADVVAENGGRVELIDLTPGVSTTSILGRMWQR